MVRVWSPYNTRTKKVKACFYVEPRIRFYTRTRKIKNEVTNRRGKKGPLNLKKSCIINGLKDLEIGSTDPGTMVGAYADPNSLRLRLDLAEMSKKLKITIFGRLFALGVTAPTIVVPDQGQNWCRLSWRHKEMIDISCTAQFVTHQEIWPKTDSCIFIH